MSTCGSCAVHQRMKVARWLMGKFSSPVFRRPIRPVSDEQVEGIRQGLREIEYETVR